MGGDRRDLARGSASRRTASPRCAGSARLGVRIKPRRLIDLVLRTGPAGDLFGLRRVGLSLRRSTQSPHGMVLDEHIATGRARRALAPPRQARAPRSTRRSPARSSGWRRPTARTPTIPLRLIGMRELRSHNSWMHNAPLLMRGDRSPRAADASRRRRARRARRRRRRRESARPRARSRCPSSVTDEMMPGTVALPHGWGHRGGWQVANEARRRQRQPSCSLRPGGPRAACRHGVPERHSGARGGGGGQGGRRQSRSRPPRSSDPVSGTPRLSDRGCPVRRAGHACAPRATVGQAPRPAARRGTASR